MRRGAAAGAECHFGRGAGVNNKNRGCHHFLLTTMRVKIAKLCSSLRERTQSIDSNLLHLYAIISADLQNDDFFTLDNA